jgi:hypothetical protein
LLWTKYPDTVDPAETPQKFRVTEVPPLLASTGTFAPAVTEPGQTAAPAVALPRPSQKCAVPVEGPAPFIVPAAVPVLETFIVQVYAVATGPQTTELETIDIVAGLALVPKIPNTNVAIATAAMRVIAMRMTVASTGEMAFLFLLFTIFIVSFRQDNLFIKGVWSFSLDFNQLFQPFGNP